MSDDHVQWTDVAPRDGLQNISATVATDDKIRLIRGLLDAGAPRVEATSFVSPRWVPQLADAASVLEGLGESSLPRLRVLIPNLRGLELALEHGVRSVLVTIGATDSFNRRNVNRSVDESIDELRAICKRGHANDCQVDVALSVSFGCPFEGRVAPARVVELCGRLVDAGADEVGAADTIGVATPAAVTDMSHRLRDVVPAGRLSVHVHDTRGLGVANVVAAYQAGVRRFDGSVGGVGGCPFAPRSTGNVCSEDALQALQSLGASIDSDIAALCDVATQLEQVLGHPLPGKLYRAGVWTGDPMVSESVEDRVG
ncbi:MAG: hydroxymethylglutaryl-CoA lyase [Candidatus Dormibacteraeota bacterium]|nr:hydroxymethylglutaryl-CoA lyase [Candidatus Dormibacteraeota bacterium]